MASHDVPALSTPERALSIPLLVREAIGSCLFCGGALTLAALWPPAPGSPNVAVSTYIALALAALACGASVITGTRFNSFSLPTGALIRAARGVLSPNEAVATVLAQFAGAAIAGFAVSAFVSRPIVSIPDIWSVGAAHELAAAFVLGVAARLALRGASMLVWTIGIAAAALIGGGFLGCPSVLIGNAMSDLAAGHRELFGGALGAQTVGIIFAAFAPLPAFGAADVATSADRSA